MVAYRKGYVSLQGDERDLKRRLTTPVGEHARPETRASGEIGPRARPGSR
jgi:hypothetical protein